MFEFFKKQKKKSDKHQLTDAEINRLFLERLEKTNGLPPLSLQNQQADSEKNSTESFSEIELDRSIAAIPETTRVEYLAETKSRHADSEKELAKPASVSTSTSRSDKKQKNSNYSYSHRSYENPALFKEPKFPKNSDFITHGEAVAATEKALKRKK